MTDAAIPVTQSAVERITEQYLQSLGCTIEKQDNQWVITSPDSAHSELLTDGLTLVCGDEDDVGGRDNVEPLHPESAFFQRILSQASERGPTGKIAIDATGSDIRIPEWLRQSDVEVSAADFAPYYDRTAVVILYQVTIETVSEYQSEFLRAIALDVRSEEFLPPLEQTFLGLTSVDGATVTSDQAEIDPADARKLLDTANERLIERIDETVDDIHHEASRAADAEVEEYRQMQQQRTQELEEKRSNLSSKVDELSERIDSSEEAERVEALKKRKELKSDLQDVEAELKDVRQRRDQGFRERQSEIRERHALDVQTKPVTLTEVEYERGEIEFELTMGERRQTVTVGYGSGVGVTEVIRCASCDERFSEDTLLGSITRGLKCEDCVSQKESRHG